MPFILKAMLSTAQLDAVSLLVKLVITVLVPLLLGKLAREVVPKAQPWVKRHKTALSLLSNGSLICTVWQTISEAQARSLTRLADAHAMCRDRCSCA